MYTLAWLPEYRWQSHVHEASAWFVREATNSTADNELPVQWLVALQAGLTLVGNFTLWAGAYHVYVQSEEKETA